MTPKSSHISEM